MQISLSTPISKSVISRSNAEIDQLLSDARPWLYRLALAISTQPDLAEDIAQEALVRAAHSREKFRSVCEPRAWLRTVLVRCTLTALARRAAIPVGEKVVTDDPTEAIAVRQTLSRMNRVDRVILALVYFEQLNYAEIAEILDIPVGTVGSRLHSARAAFEKEWNR